MSRASKLTLAGTSLATAGIIYFVHWAQSAEKAVCSTGILEESPPGPAFPCSVSCVKLKRQLERVLTLQLIQAMHAGVERDIEQQRIKRERQADFAMQKALEEEYRKVQTVSGGGGTRNVGEEKAISQGT